MRIPSEGFFQSSDDEVELYAQPNQQGDEGYFDHFDQHGARYEKSFDMANKCVLFVSAQKRVRCDDLVKAIVEFQKRRKSDLQK